VGIGIVWIPAALILLFDGEWMRAFILIVSFTGLAAVASLLYPHIVGNRMKLHSAVAFMATVGGLIVFGPSGFILGPVVIAVVLAVRDILRGRAAQTFELKPSA
jgi:predicted PurR-regulated permease PerM